MGSIVFNIAGDPPRLPGREVIADADGDPQNGIQADLAATTPDCQGGDAVLVVDGADVATVPVTDATVDFGRVTLPDGPRVSVYVDVRGMPSGRSIPSEFYVDSVAPAPVILFPTAGTILRAADDKDDDPSNGVQVDLYVEAPDLELGATEPETALIEATVRDQNTGEATVLSCLASDCVEATNPNRYRLEMSLDPQASYTVEVQITDPAGNSGGDGPVAFDTDATPASVTIVSPQPGETVNTTSPGVSGTEVTVQVETSGLPEGASVAVQCSGAAGAGTGTLDAAGSASVAVDFSTAACNGEAVSCTATVMDGGGEVVSAPVDFTVDVSPPTLSIVAPSDGATLYDTQVRVELVSTCLEDGQVVTVSTDTGVSGRAQVAGDAAIVDLTLSSGTHAISATTTDAAGNPASAGPISVTVDADPPNVVFLSPVDGQTLLAADDADAAAPGLQYDVEVQVANKPAGTVIELYLGYPDGAGGYVYGAAPIQTGTTAANLRASFAAVTLPEGAFSLKGVAVGQSGLRGEQAISVTVDTPALVCNVLAPPHGASLGAAADANGDPADGIQGQVVVQTDGADGTAVTVTVVDGDGNTNTYMGTATGGTAPLSPVTFSPVSGSPFGRNRVSATCDDAGTTGQSLTHTVDVDLEAPEAVIAEPADGRIFNAADLDASAEPGFQVVFVGTAADPSSGLPVKSGSTGEVAVDCGSGMSTVAVVFADDGAGGTEARTRITLEDQSTCTISFTVTDAAGNQSQPVTHTVSVDRIPPTCAFSDPTLDGKLLGRNSDTSLAQPGLQYDVGVDFDGLEAGQSVSLLAARSSEGGVESPVDSYSVGAGEMSHVFAGATVTPADTDVVTLRVQASDAAGNSCEDTATVTVDLVAPDVTITRPTDNDPCYNLLSDLDHNTPQIQIQVDVATVGVADGLPLDLCADTATGPACGTAGFFQAAPPQQVNSSKAFFLGVSIPDGSTQLLAEVRDLAGNASASPPVTICADSVPPDVSAATVITDSDADGAVNAAEYAASGDSVCFQVTVSDADGQTIRAFTNNPSADTVVATATVSGGMATLCGAMAEGGHQVEIVTTDVNGNPNLRDSNPTILDPEAVLSLTVDLTPPALSIVQPASGTVYLNASDDVDPAVPGLQYDFIVTSDAEGRTVTFDVGGQVQTATVSGGTASARYTLSEGGPYDFTATVSDAAGNSTTQTRQGILVDTVAPTVSIQQPADGAALGSNAIDVVVDVQGAETTQTVRIIQTAPGPETEIGSALVSGTQPQTIPVNLADGSYTLVARVSDAAGNPAESSPVSFTVDTVGCSLVFTDPVGSTVTWNLSDDTDANTPGLQVTLVTQTSDCPGLDVDLLKNGTLTATQTSDAAGVASFPVSLNDGETGTFTARIVDAAMNVTTVSFDFTVDITPPSMTETYPNAGSAYAYVTAANPTVGTTVGGYFRIADKVAGVPAEADFSFDVSGAAGGTFWIELSGSTVFGPDPVTTDPETKSVTDLSLPQDTAGQLIAYVQDAAGNTVSITHDVLVDVVAPGVPAVSLTLVDARDAQVDVSWSAQGDDGSTGTPAEYRIGWDTTPITNEAEFDAATLVTAAGTATTQALTGLPPLNTYSVAVRAADELDNLSPLTPGTNIASQDNLWTQQVYTQNRTTFGLALAPVSGDLNNDGFDDLVVADPLVNGNEGKVYIYYGAADLSTVVPQELTAPYTDPGRRFGWALDVGDVSGDGLDDLVVAQRDKESVWIYFGVSSGQVDAASPIEIRRPRPMNEPEIDFGESLRILGDVTGDGIRDLIVGAKLEAGVGSARIYAGRSISAWQTAASGGYVPYDSADITIMGTDVDGNFGYRQGFADLGDFDGDMRSDFVVPQSNTGKVWVFRSSDLVGAGPFTTNDAWQQIVVGDPATDPDWASDLGKEAASFVADAAGTRVLVLTSPGSSPSRVFLFVVDSMGVQLPYLLEFTRTGVSLWGFSATYGQLDSSGFPDLVLGTNGINTHRVYVHYNDGVSPYFSPDADSTLIKDGVHGYAVSTGDFNGDGRQDLAGAAPAANKVYVYY
ncbi:MAG: hypothetical protein D6729_10105 [Deltaproteobacteria bacterium]|nr:MAG: hypothetical protein D6729_10105 [Deltaproteobacteria bacterium]